MECEGPETTKDTNERMRRRSEEPRMVGDSGKRSERGKERREMAVEKPGSKTSAVAVYKRTRPTKAEG